MIGAEFVMFIIYHRLILRAYIFLIDPCGATTVSKDQAEQYLGASTAGANLEKSLKVEEAKVLEFLAMQSTDF